MSVEALKRHVSPPIEGSLILKQSLCRPSPATACVTQNQYQHFVVTFTLTHKMIFPIFDAEKSNVLSPKSNVLSPYHLKKAMSYHLKKAMSYHPTWTDRNLVSRIEHLLKVDPSSACQRLFNATIQDLREKILGLEVENPCKTDFDLNLSPIVEKQRLTFCPTMQLIELSHKLRILTGAERERILRCYQIICELVREEDEYKLDAQKIIFLFKSCVSCVLGKEPVVLRGEAKGKISPGQEIYTRPVFNTLEDNEQTCFLSENMPQKLEVEKTLNKKLHFLEAILDAMPQMIIYHDSNLNVIWANKVAGDYVGLKRDEMIGKYFYDVACGNKKPCDDCPIWKGFDTGICTTTENHLLGGRLFFSGSYPAFHDGMKLPGMLVVSEDITDRKYRYGVNEILNLISEVFSVSEGSKIIYEKVLETIMEQFNYPTGAITLYEENINEVVVLGKVDHSKRLISRAICQTVFEAVTGLVLQDGKTISITNLISNPDFDEYELKRLGAETVNAIPLNAEGHTIGALILVDYTERLDVNLILSPLEAVANRLGAEVLRKQIEEALREEQNFTTAVLNNAGSLIMVLDKEGRIVRFNKTCERLTGYSHLELKGCYLWERLLVTGEKDVFANLFPFSRDKVKLLPPTIENHWLTKGGQKRLISWSNTIMGDDKKTEIHIVSIGIDITEKKKIEEEAELGRRQLIQADKMASLGILVSGVAHEINNPNNFIAMNASLLRDAWMDIMPILDKYFAKNGDFRLANISFSEMRARIPTLFDGIQEGSGRIDQIVMNLRDYAREDVSDMTQEVNLNKVLAVVLRLLSNQIKKSTENLKVTYERKLPAVIGNFQRLEQVIVNLVQNACQALPANDKRIDIRTFNDRKKNEVVVRIKDEGIGIAKEHLDTIYDPFFTTKRDTGGTGLGLSMCAGIVKEHGGRLQFLSEVGKGTTVLLALPTKKVRDPM